MEMKNREYVKNKLIEKTNMSKENCEKICDILDNHFIVGRNNKEKIKKDFIENFKIDETEADKLYNICMEVIMKNIFC